MARVGVERVLALGDFLRYAHERKPMNFKAEEEVKMRTLPDCQINFYSLQ